MTDAPEMIRAAGLLLRDPAGRILLVRRAGEGDHLGEWGIPGGKLEGDETPLAGALRETREETGYDLPEGVALVELTRRIAEGVDFTTFLVDVPASFNPVLNDEHDAFTWELPDDVVFLTPPLTAAP
jgi:8-oxo-dGTP pyrophosphatase MutT (NUDIX family)